MTASISDGSPEEGGNLLLVLMHHQQFSDSSVCDGACGPHGTYLPLSLQDLAVDYSHQFLEHGLGEVGDGCSNAMLGQWLQE